MKKLIIFLALISTTPAMSATRLPHAHPYNQYQIQSANRRAAHAEQKAQKATHIATAAVLVAVMATIIAVQASENNPGQIQLARF